MNIRLYNARILSMREGSGIEEGEVWVEGSHITYMGPRKDTETAWDREIDVRGNVVMPGFKNAHTHSAMTFLRSYTDGIPDGGEAYPGRYVPSVQAGGHGIRDERYHRQF